MASVGFQPYRPPTATGGFTVGADGNLTPNAQRPSNIANPQQSVNNQYRLYNSGVAQNAQDYGDIMSGFRNVLAHPNSTGQYTPQTYDYKPTAEYQGAVSNLQGLAENGGYTEQGINDLRERGISPIRAVYANAQRNMDRNRALSGGYSPNYNAASARMAREMSDAIANQVTNVNAGLAQNVASNRLQVAPQLASVTAGENELRNTFGARNADTINSANQFNIANQRQTQANQLAALQGMSSLYGTTPALTNLFGNQALQRSQFENQVAQQNNQNGLGALSAAMRLV